MRSKPKRPGWAKLQSHSDPVTGYRGGVSKTAGHAHNHRGAVLICIFLAVGIWAVFGQTIGYEFVNYDDDVNVYDNPAITQGITWSGIAWAFTHFNNFEWLPLNAISHMLDCQVFGLHAGGHHLTNVLLHAATAICLFLTLRSLTRTFWRSAFVSAVFALHPLRVESVAWVTERKDVLSGLFFVLTIGAYISYVRQPKKARYVLVLALFAFGLLSKAMVVTLPFVLLLLDYWPLGRGGGGSQPIPDPNGPANLPSSQTGRRLIIEKIPLLLLAGAACVATFLATRKAESVLAVQGLTLPYRVANALVAYVDYLGHLLYPAGLTVGYPSPGNHLAVWKIAWSVLVLVVISAGAVAWRRRCPGLLLGWLWYLGMLVPVIDVMQAGQQARADRYTYLSQIGLAILGAWGAVELFKTWPYKATTLGAASAAILAGLMVAAHAQTAYWKDSVTLWTHCLACVPESSLGHNNLGTALIAQNKFDEAISQFKQALQIKPDYIEAQNNLGFALVAQGKFAEAIQPFTRALQLKPDFAKAHLNLGIALAAQGKIAEAIEHYQRALQLDPNYTEAQFNLGLALVTQGKSAEAIEHYQRALQLRPNYGEAHSSLGLALARRGDLPLAIEHLRRALELKPDYSPAHNNLGVALAAQGKLDEAIRQFEQAVQLKPDNTEARNNLNRALAAATEQQPKPGGRTP